MLKTLYLRAIQLLAILALFSLLFTKSFSTFAIIYSFIAVFLIIHMWLSKNHWKTKIIFTIIYILIMAGQHVMNVYFVFSGEQTGIIFLFKKLIAIMTMFVPFFVLYVNYLYNLQYQFSHSLKDATVVSFDMIKEIHRRGNALKHKVNKGKNTLSKDNLDVILQDIPRHSYTKYINKKSLTEEYFSECKKSLEDEHLYIVLSNTGSPASELISLFTNKAYNHVSLSFDRNLKTIISYNGGENVSPPGLNQEQLEFFHKKDDASILVYKLAAPREKKQLAIEKVREINETGSAYNLVGLVTKFSIRPNIMFCSQFVYNMLKVTGLAYFQSPATKIKPTDLVEKDYFRKLEFCYEIKFNEL